MRALLLSPDRDFNVDAPLPANADDVVQDLELTTILRAGAGADRDELIWKVLAQALLNAPTDVATVFYRQEMLADCQQFPDLIRELYTLAGDALETQRTVWRSSFSRDQPNVVVSRSVQILGMLEEFLHRLRAIAEEHAPAFHSAGFTRFFEMLVSELDDAYLSEFHDRLGELAFKEGLLVSAHLGPGNRSIEYVARRHPHRTLLERVNPLERSGYSFSIPARDDAGFQALEQIKDRGLNDIANAVGQSCDHVLAFFQRLRIELAFYVGALNLEDRLAQLDVHGCRPEVVAHRAFTATGLYDLALTLRIERAPVPNDVLAEDRPLMMITGANQGGKSTLLRAIGQAQLMSQAGLSVGAESLQINPVHGVFTHYKREEDASMDSGKLDEELARMSQIVDQAHPGSLLLCNESFASTNEREGSEIARQIIRAMLNAKIKIVFVTHQYDLAGSFYNDEHERARTLFLRAGREEGGKRTYRLSQEPPQTTSYGADSYQEVFGTAIEPKPAAAAIQS